MPRKLYLSRCAQICRPRIFVKMTKSHGLGDFCRSEVRTGTREERHYLKPGVDSALGDVGNSFGVTFAACEHSFRSVSRRKSGCYGQHFYLLP